MPSELGFMEVPSMIELYGDAKRVGLYGGAKYDYAFWRCQVWLGFEVTKYDWALKVPIKIELYRVSTEVGL